MWAQVCTAPLHALGIAKVCLTSVLAEAGVIAHREAFPSVHEYQEHLVQAMHKLNASNSRVLPALTLSFIYLLHNHAGKPKVTMNYTSSLT